jgi:hypothetical protein
MSQVNRFTQYLGVFHEYLNISRLLNLTSDELKAISQIRARIVNLSYNDIGEHVHYLKDTKWHTVNLRCSQYKGPGEHLCSICSPIRR